MAPSARGKLQTLISQQCEGWGALSWLSVSLEGSAPSLGPGEGGSFGGGGCLGRPFSLSVHGVGRGWSACAAPSSRGLQLLPHSLQKIGVEKEGEESRREPPGGFRPQTLPL